MPDTLKTIATILAVVVVAVLALVGWACLVAAKDADGPSDRLLSSHDADEPGEMLT